MDTTRHIKLGKNISRKGSEGNMHTTFSSSCSTSYNDCQVIPSNTSNGENVSSLFYPMHVYNRSRKSSNIIRCMQIYKLRYFAK